MRWDEVQLTSGMCEWWRKESSGPAVLRRAMDRTSCLVMVLVPRSRVFSQLEYSSPDCNVLLRWTQLSPSLFDQVRAQYFRQGHRENLRYQSRNNDLQQEKERGTAEKRTEGGTRGRSTEREAIKRGTWEDGPLSTYTLKRVILIMQRSTSQRTSWREGKSTHPAPTLTPTSNIICQTLISTVLANQANQDVVGTSTGLDVEGTGDVRPRLALSRAGESSSAPEEERCAEAGYGSEEGKEEEGEGGPPPPPLPPPSGEMRPEPASAEEKRLLC